MLGLCLGACLAVTVVYFYPASQTYWLMVTAAVVSIAVAVWRRPGLSRPERTHRAAGGDRRRGGTRGVQLSAGWTPHGGAGRRLSDRRHERLRVGDQRTDARSLRDARKLKSSYSDLSIVALTNYGRGSQQLDISALEANFNSLFGLGATDTQSACLIAVLLVGALGAFGVVRTADRRSGWAAVLAGCLYAGPAFTQLLMEGSQAAITGTAVLAPLIAVGLEALRRPRVANLILLGLMAAGLQTVYPLFIPCVVIGAGLTLGLVLVRALRRRTLTARGVLRAALALALVLACAIVFTPVAFSRNAAYWSDILHGQLSFAGLPGYRLPAPVLPGWALQTRDFYTLTNPLNGATLGQLVLAGVLRSSSSRSSLRASGATGRRWRCRRSRPGPSCWPITPGTATAAATAYSAISFQRQRWSRRGWP